MAGAGVFPYMGRIRIRRGRVIFAALLVILVWSLRGVPKLYPLKLHCVEAQLNEKEMVC